MESVPGGVIVSTLGLLALTVVALAAALVRARRRERVRAAAASADAVALRDRVEALEHRLAAPTAPTTRAVDDVEYVVTMLGRESTEDPAADASAPVVPGPLFADLVVREGVVQAASLAAGLRRALSPESRNRIRFEMRREVKRARKQRRADLRQARRELQARQRAGLDGAAGPEAEAA